MEEKNTQNNQQPDKNPETQAQSMPEQRTQPTTQPEGQNSVEQTDQNVQSPSPSEQAPEQGAQTEQPATQGQPQIIINNNQPQQEQKEEADFTPPPRTQPTVVYPKNPFPWHRIIYAIETIISILLVFRIFLSMFAANDTSEIVRAVFLVTDPLIAPFKNIFPQTTSGELTVDWSIFIAMVVYAILAGIMGKVIQIILYRNR